MRIFTGGIAHVAGTIEDDLASRETSLYKTHISGIADVVACVLSCRNVNTGDWIPLLPRRVGDEKSKERYISRLLSNKRIDPVDVMKGFIPELTEMMTDQDQTLVLMIDQSKISEGFECLMISLRLKERAIPVVWRVVQTQGPIGFEVQESLLNEAVSMLPEEAAVMLTGDLFYGTAALIRWCQRQGWQYRLRLKSNLILEHDGGEITTGEAYRKGLKSLEQARFHKTDVTTSIGILHEPGHPEPWIMAMEGKPSAHKVLDYVMRWGIECLFSDFKSRGFSITKTHLRHTDRIERLILVLTIALYWVVSTGMQPSKKRLIRKNKPIAP